MLQYTPEHTDETNADAHTEFISSITYDIDWAMMPDKKKEFLQKVNDPVVADLIAILRIYMPIPILPPYWGGFTGQAVIGQSVTGKPLTDTTPPVTARSTSSMLKGKDDAQSSSLIWLAS